MSDLAQARASDGARTVYARYSWPRAGSAQQELTDWEYTHTPLEPAGERPSPAALSGASWSRATAFPSMLAWEVYASGDAEHPYVGTNSSDYRWTADRTWWLRTRVSADMVDPGSGRAELVFDGVDHDAWIWVDGQSAGEHHGMFGGPVLDVCAWLEDDAEAEHEVLLALRPAGLQQGKPGWGSSGRLVKSDTFCRWINNPDLMTTGIWQSVRLLRTGAHRLERPHVVTTMTEDGSCHLSAEVEVLAADVQADLEFVQRHGQAPPVHDPCFARPDDAPPTPATVTVTVHAPDGDEVATATTRIDLRPGRIWAHVDLEIPHAELWWPHGLGEDRQALYTIGFELEGAAQDRLSVRTGLRSITWERTPAPRTTDHWFDWEMSVNGVRTSGKGINWMPPDLLRFERPRYEHLLGLIKDAGIGMVRVWGGGLIETDDFYDLCDELGLLVWQDFPLNTHYDCAELPLDLWEQQVLWNIERLRNRPSLAIWCGGNEIDPYLPGNAGVIGIAERTIVDLDGTRPFMRSCSDPGDVHPYLECDSTWYHPLYRDAPAITEWGGHTLPTVATLSEILPAEELETPLDTLSSSDEADFATSHPSLHRHWSEFNPDRIPRMLSRTRVFDDLGEASVAQAVQAIQLGSAEIYQSLITDFSAGDAQQRLLMPWVYNRPWPSVGMQAVDHSGRPTLGYYAIKRGFRAGAFVVRPSHEALAPGESLQLDLGLTLGVRERPYRLSVLDQELQLLHHGAGTLVQDGFTAVEVDVPPSARTLFVVVVDPEDPEAQHVRVVRISSELADDAARSAYRERPRPTAHFMDGSLRAITAQARTTVETEVRIDDGATAADDAATPRTHRLLATLRNTGDRPAAYLVLESTDPRWLLIPEDSGFWLESGTSRTVSVLARPAAEVSTLVTEPPTGIGPDVLSVQAWNA